MTSGDHAELGQRPPSSVVPGCRPALGFIGVTTGQSSIRRVFPVWAVLLGLDAELRGIDLPLDAPPAAYRQVVQALRADPLARGALVTTHKIGLFQACRDLFDEVDPQAALLGETSCLAKRDGRLIAHAKDPAAAGLALAGMLGAGYFAQCERAVLCMGAGGAGLAIMCHLLRRAQDGDWPARIVVTERSQARLAEMVRIHGVLGADLPLACRLVADASENDALLAALPAGALVINATGLGKDAPGSPLSDAARFPEGAIAWDLNYRGDLRFLAQARRQQAARGLQVEDGWTYFLHGWTQVIAEVFGLDIPPAGRLFARLAEAAAAARG